MINLLLTEIGLQAIKTIGISQNSNLDAFYLFDQDRRFIPILVSIDTDWANLVILKGFGSRKDSLKP